MISGPKTGRASDRHVISHLTTPDCNQQIVVTEIIIEEAFNCTVKLKPDLPTDPATESIVIMLHGHSSFSDVTYLKSVELLVD